MERKKRLRIIQSFLLIFSLLIIFFTYKLNNKNFTEKSDFKTTNIVNQNLGDLNKTEGDVFYDIEYVGLDLAGNRYILKSKEAFTNKNSTEVLYSSIKLINKKANQFDCCIFFFYTYLNFLVQDNFPYFPYLEFLFD